VPAFRARGAEIVSPRAFARTEEAEAVLAGFGLEGVATCEFCTPQRILIAGLLLDEAAGATDERILEAMQTVQCRCVEPSALVKGVRAAVGIRSGREWRRAR
jgi:aerobic-type carbon monoxide dehydrogenase small subunit (CoxS/CutS family)